jgi:hypothetical protein
MWRTRLLRRSELGISYDVWRTGKYKLMTIIIIDCDALMYNTHALAKQIIQYFKLCLL